MHGTDIAQTHNAGESAGALPVFRAGRRIYFAIIVIYFAIYFAIPYPIEHEWYYCCILAVEVSG